MVAILGRRFNFNYYEDVTCFLLLLPASWKKVSSKLENGTGTIFRMPWSHVFLAKRKSLASCLGFWRITSEIDICITPGRESRQKVIIIRCKMNLWIQRASEILGYFFFFTVLNFAVIFGLKKARGSPTFLKRFRWFHFRVYNRHLGPRNANQDTADLLPKLVKLAF